MQYKTFKVRRVYVFAAIFFFIVAITVFMFLRAFSELKAVTPEQVTDYSNMELIQLNAPPENGSYARITTSMGEMVMVMYENEAPNAVNLFKSSVTDGSLNGLSAGLYEQGSVFTIDVPAESSYLAEFHKNLWPFRGAVCMTPDGDIVFINTVAFSDEEREYLSAEEGALPEVRNAFLEHGGVPNFAGQYAVFGQITEGMDILQAISSSPADSEIIIRSIELI